MLITALTKFTAIDFPGKLACIIFTGGCNLRCGFCHNPEFVIPEKLEEMKKSAIPFESVLNFLKARQEMLEGVVICGGEPTVQPDLIDRMRDIRGLGFAIKLDTNGLNPGVLRRAITEGLVDYIAMDLKMPINYSKELVGVTIANGVLAESVEMIMNSGIDYEFRTTVIPGIHNEKVLAEMGEQILGAAKWALQGFRNAKTLSPVFENIANADKVNLQILADSIKSYAREVIVR
jgi:pyruvate formate lyase activating enzyme